MLKPVQITIMTRPKPECWDWAGPSLLRAPKIPGDSSSEAISTFTWRAQVLLWVARMYCSSSFSDFRATTSSSRLRFFSSQLLIFSWRVSIWCKSSSTFLLFALPMRSQLLQSGVTTVVEPDIWEVFLSHHHQYLSVTSSHNNPRNSTVLCSIAE